MKTLITVLLLIGTLFPQESMYFNDFQWMNWQEAAGGGPMIFIDDTERLSIPLGLGDVFEGYYFSNHMTEMSDFGCPTLYQTMFVPIDSLTGQPLSTDMGMCNPNQVFWGDPDTLLVHQFSWPDAGVQSLKDSADYIFDSTSKLVYNGQGDLISGTRDTLIMTEIEFLSDAGFHIKQWWFLQPPHLKANIFSLYPQPSQMEGVNDPENQCLDQDDLRSCDSYADSLVSYHAKLVDENFEDVYLDPMIRGPHGFSAYDFNPINSETGMVDPEALLLDEIVFPDGPTIIYVQGGPTRIHGTYTGQYTVVTDEFTTYRRHAWPNYNLYGEPPVDTLWNNIWLINNLVNADAPTGNLAEFQPDENCDGGSENSMALVSGANVIVANTGENGARNSTWDSDINVHAMILALNESFVAQYWQNTVGINSGLYSNPPFGDGRGIEKFGESGNQDYRGYLTLWGSVIQRYRGFVKRNQPGAYSTGDIGYDKDYHYDWNLSCSTPPGFDSENWLVLLAGCTDPEADNFNPDAELDDGSCVYNQEADLQVLQDIIDINGWQMDPQDLGTQQWYEGRLTYLRYHAYMGEPLTILPESIGDLDQLEVLHLGNNELSSLPESMISLSNLRDLSFGGNLFTEVPLFICELTGLHYLEFAFNQLSSLPECLGNLDDLEYISFSNNDISTIPDSFQNLGRLEYLEASLNQLTELPESITHLDRLETLRLFGNQISYIHPNIGNMEDLEQLDMELNQITVLPNNFSLLESLFSCNLRNNQLTTLPQDLSGLQSLFDLNIQNNKLVELPETIGTLSSLQELWLENNHILSLPESLGDLPVIDVLDLVSNNLTSLPESLDDLTTLRSLDISGNYLFCNGEEYDSGLIPEYLTDGSIEWVDGLEIQDCPPLSGCTDYQALNYDPDAGLDDGSCFYIPQCFSHDDCNDGGPPPYYFCVPFPGECDYEEIPGQCIESDLDCYLDWQPVCGCDGTTYANECIAQSWYGAGIVSGGICDNRSLYHVADNGDFETGDGSPDNPLLKIQFGINAAEDGDTVLVHPGTYFENINFNGKNILVGSMFIMTGDTSFISQTVIDGNQEGSVVVFETEETQEAFLSGFTIQNGLAEEGGGIFCDHSSPFLSYLHLMNNAATQVGGGLCADHSDLNASHLIITQNASAINGGGIYISGSEAQFEDLAVTGNQAGNYGGGFYNAQSDAILQNSIFSQNSASSGGGAFIFSGQPQLSELIITENHADADGGGVYLRHTDQLFSHINVTSNTAAGFGGGIYCETSSSLIYDSENRCNIYSNNTYSRGNGADIYEAGNSPVSVVVDTFTVLTPTDYHASPIELFSFDILQGVDELVAENLFVSPSGDDSNDGLTNETPLKTIRRAMSIIQADSLNPKTIHLAEGTYSPETNGEIFPVDIIDWVHLVGASQNFVVLDADSTASVVHFNYSRGSSIQNVTLIGGSALRGGGLFCYESRCNISNITVEQNSAVAHGGGVYCTASDVTIEYVRIAANYAEYGGGMYIASSNNDTYHIHHITFTDNSAYSGGGLTHNHDTEFSDLQFYNNYAETWGGAIRIINGDPTFNRMVMAYNHAGLSASAMYLSNGSPLITNSTIAYNGVADNSPTTIFGQHGSHPVIENSILYANETDMNISFHPFWEYNSVTISYSDLQGGLESIDTIENADIIWSDGNIDEDPLFTDPWNDGFQLQPESPCIDAGDPDSPLDPDGTVSDIGTYYFHHVLIDDLQNFDYILNGMLDDYLTFSDTTGFGEFHTVTVGDVGGGEIGDEIGLLDYNGLINLGDCNEEYGEILVGAGIWNGGPLTITTYAAMDFCADEDPDYGQYPGWIPGNPIGVLYWRASENQVYSGSLNGETGELTWQPGELNVPLLTINLNPPYDVNGDLSLDILDVVIVVEYILELSDLEWEEVQPADTNNDGFLDILDVVTMIAWILEVY